MLLVKSPYRKGRISSARPIHWSYITTTVVYCQTGQIYPAILHGEYLRWAQDIDILYGMDDFY